MITTAPRFLIAKYVPNTKRMEPRNIGVILWADGKLAAKFIGEDASTGEIVSRPKFVRITNFPVYRDWIMFWRLQMKESLRDGKTLLNPSDPSFVDALRLKSRANYVLVDGGFLAAQVNRNKIDMAVEKLFDELVGDRVADSDSTPAKALDSACKVFLAQTGLKDVDNFHAEYPVKYTFRGVEDEVAFSYGIGPGGYVDSGLAPSALFQKARLQDHDGVRKTLFLLESVTRPGMEIVPQNRCASLINATDEDLSEPTTRHFADMLGTVGTVINVANENTWESGLEAMGVNLNGHRRSI